MKGDAISTARTTGLTVAVLSVRDPIPVYNGLLERTYQTCRFLGERHDVTVYFPYEPSRHRTKTGRIPNEQPFERVGLQSRAIDLLDRLVPSYSPLRALYHMHPWLYRPLRKAFMRNPPDVIVVEFPFLVPLARLASRGLNATILLSEHNVEFTFAKRLDIPFWQVLKWYELLVCKHVDAVLTVSETDRDTLKRHLNGHTAIDVAKNGVDLTQYHPTKKDRADEIRSKYGLTSPVLVFHGELGNAQNAPVVDLLVDEVFPQIRMDHPDATLLLIGADGPTKQMDNVVVTGIVDDLPRHLAAADVAVAPMLAGSGTNLKIIEYLATGLPIVTTELGAEGLSLEHERDALIVTPDAVPDAVSRILKNEELHTTLAVNGRALAESSFGWSQTLQPYESHMHQPVIQ